MNEADNYPSAVTYQRRFGSWNKAKQAAGLKTRGKGTGSRNPSYTDAELLAMLNDFARKHGGSVTKSELNVADGYPSPTTYTRRFGSWQNAKKQAGIVQ
jgi:hypothetical protein